LDPEFSARPFELFLYTRKSSSPCREVSAHANMDRKSDRQKLALRKAQNHSTPSSRRHHFVPFTQRIASLKIDPIRRQRNHDDHEDSDLTSHFRTSLDKWREINQSDDFTRFSRQVDSLCDSLPQVLHHQQRIIDLLLEYIAKGTTVAVEPLLDLVPRLAQDVQAQFETHFERTVTTITILAAKHPDLEVVEWSFNCLAWLFKYLERLLVSDLRPLYTLLAPLLGKDKQRDFIIRFAAESLSFLVKKASKKRDSLATIIEFALEDLCQTAQERNAEPYQAGIRSLFLEAIMSMQMHIHSKGDVIFDELSSHIFEMNDVDARRAQPAVRVLQDILGQIVHRTTSDTFKPIFDVLAAQVRLQGGQNSEHRLTLSAQLLLLVVGVKSGTRVNDWSAILQLLSTYISFLSVQNPDKYPQAASEILAVFALSHHICPLDVAISHTKVFEEICSGKWQQFFLGFCSLYSELGNDRFCTLLLSYFQKYVWLVYIFPKPNLLILTGSSPNSGMRLIEHCAFCFLNSPEKASSVKFLSKFPPPGLPRLLKTSIIYLRPMMRIAKVLSLPPILTVSSRCQEPYLWNLRLRPASAIKCAKLCANCFKTITSNLLRR
jgi:U3 small nucleolar RNA-associated protein 20